MHINEFTQENIKLSLIEDEPNNTKSYFEIVVNRNFLNMVFCNLLLTKNSLPPLETKLTQREKEILLLISQGKDNGEIAEHLNVSEHTAKMYISLIYRKLKVKDRTEAVVKAIRYDLIDIYS